MKYAENISLQIHRQVVQVIYVLLSTHKNLTYLFLKFVQQVWITLQLEKDFNLQIDTAKEMLKPIRINNCFLKLVGQVFQQYLVLHLELVLIKEW